MKQAPLPPIGEIHDYVKIAADAYQLNPTDLMDNSRSQPRAFARQVSMHLAIVEGHHTRHALALHYNKDIATINYAVTRVADELETSDQFLELYKKLETKCPKP